MTLRRRARIGSINKSAERETPPPSKITSGSTTCWIDAIAGARKSTVFARMGVAQASPLAGSGKEIFSGQAVSFFRAYGVLPQRLAQIFTVRIDF